MKKKVAVWVLLAGAVLALGGCGGLKDAAREKVLSWAENEETEADRRSGVEYFADQMSEAMERNAEEKAAERESARNEGDGDRVVIRSEQDLLKFRDQVNGGEPAVDAILEADLDLSDVCSESLGSWEPIMKYNGTFEGNGHAIRNLYFSGSEEDFGGLFGSADVDSVIQNLSVEDVRMSGGKYAGAVVGHTSGSVINCQSSGTITSSGRAVGGIVGQANGQGQREQAPVISDCVNYAEISNTGTVKCIAGGVAGYLIETDASNCRNEGKVSGTSSTVGGVFGALEGQRGVPVTITDCVNTADVDGQIYVGGFCGDAEYCILNRCKNSGAVTGYIYTGGLCGYFGGEKSKSQKLVALMENCSNEGLVSLNYMEFNGFLKPGDAIYDAQQAGGLAGVMETSIVLNSRNSGDLICDTGKNYLYCGAGHLAVGKNQGNRNLLLNCVSTAAITPPEDSEHFENSRTATGKFDGHQDSALIFYIGEKVLEEIEPTPESALGDGTVLAALNGFPEGVPEELMTRLEESGLEYEVCLWKAGPDSAPVLEWE